MERKSDVFRVALRAGKGSMGESLVRRVPINAGVQWAAKYWGYKDKTHALRSQGAQARAGEMNATYVYVNKYIENDRMISILQRYARFLHTSP